MAQLGYLDRIWVISMPVLCIVFTKVMDAHAVNVRVSYVLTGPITGRSVAEPVARAFTVLLTDYRKTVRPFMDVEGRRRVTVLLHVGFVCALVVFFSSLPL